MSRVKGKPTSPEVPKFDTVGNFLQYFATKKPDADAVVFCSTDGPRVTVSWKKMSENSYKMAKAFVNMGVKPGECVALVTRTCPEWLYITFGAMLAGARVAGMVFTYNDGSDVIALMKKIGNCSVMVLDPGFEESNWNIFKTLIDTQSPDGHVDSLKLPFLRNLIFLNTPENVTGKTVNQLLEQDFSSSQLPEYSPDDIAYLFQTSGSTGVPKLLAHTYRSILNLSQVFRIDHLTEDDVFFFERPFSWAGGFPMGLFIGQTRVTVSGFCPEPKDKVSFLIDVVQKESCTVAALFVNMIQDVEKRLEYLPSKWPLKSIFTGGQPITKSVTSCVGRLCENLIIIYGSSEFFIGAGNTFNDPQQFEDYLAGKPLPGCEYKVIDKDEVTVSLGERGELCMRGPCLYKEYFNDPEKTARATTRDGWYRTDDIGRISKEGNIYVEGRMSNMIISGGMNVGPAILESAIKAYSGIKSVVVVPVSDEAMYQVVCACVCVWSGSDVTELKLRDFLEEMHNDKQKLFTVLPTYYLFMDDFPEGGTGKISRLTLKNMAEEKFGGKHPTH